MMNKNNLKINNMKNLVKISFLAFSVLSATLFQSCGNNDERYRKDIVGTYSYAKTMDIDEETTATMQGTVVFDANGYHEDNGTIVITFIDEDGESYNLTLQCTVKGKYSIKNSVISYDFKLQDVDVQIVNYNNYEVAKYFQQHALPEFKNELCVDNNEKILELTDKYLKTEDVDDDGEKIVITYLRTSEPLPNNAQVEQETAYSDASNLQKSDMPADFLSFLNEFTSSREAQILLIHTPLTHYFFDESFEDKLEQWNEEKIITDWRFYTSTDFFWGTRQAEDGEYLGSWQLKDGVLNYTIGIPEATTLLAFSFGKVNGGWQLVSYWTNESGF
jgi:hypothetical protein